MAKRFVSVEKETSFQGRGERWSNVYCFEMAGTTLSDHEAIQTACLNAEKPLYHPEVKIVRTRVFTTDGLNLGDSGDMYSVLEHNVAGTASAGSLTPYTEMAVLVKWPLNRKVKLGGGLGRQRSLKKWIRGLGGNAWSETVIRGKDAMGTTHKAPFVTYAAAIENIANSDLCSPDDGATPIAAAIIHPYLEHRQFPRGRKEGLL